MPNRRGGRRNKAAAEPPVAPVDRTPPWSIIYYEAQDGTCPSLSFLDGCPGKLDGEFLAVLDAVAMSPPPQFSGGGKWEAMHGAMKGYYEIRLTGPGREQFRLFCLLENGTDAELRGRGLAKPAIAVLDGRRKPWRTTLPNADYRAIRKLGEDHRAQQPRRIAT
jgi:hypothetical protein